MQIEKRNMKVTLTDEEKRIFDKAGDILSDIRYSMSADDVWNGYNTVDIVEWMKMFNDASLTGIIEIE